MPPPPGRLDRRALLIDEDPAWEDLAPTPFLGLDRLTWSAARHCPEALGEGLPLPG